jgi:CsoR family transcriptional regulator, copper-sensing transcriptional repressor
MATSELPRSSLSDHTHTAQIADDQVHGEHIHLDDVAVHPHVHSEDSLRRIVNRLSRIEGHIRGIKVMVQESRSCPDVLVQIAAVRGALDRVARVILDEHLTECVGRAAKQGNIEVEIEELKAALDRFLP